MVEVEKDSDSKFKVINKLAQDTIFGNSLIIALCD